MNELMPTTAQDTPAVSSLRALITARGRMICDDADTLQNILRQNNAGQTDQVDLLMRAQRARVPSDLIWHAVAPRADLGNRLMARLQTQHSFSEQDALWSVTSWMDALDVQAPRPRIRTATQTVPQSPGLPATPETTAAPAEASPAPERKPMKVSEAVSPNVKVKTISSQRPGLPGWAIGAVAVIFIAALGAMIYVATGPPANATRAPGVVYTLPPGYKAPTRADRIRARMMRPIRAAH